MELKQTEGPVADDCTSTSKPWSSNVSPPAKDIHASYIPPKDGFHNRRQFKRWQYSIGVTIYYVENLIKDIKESESCLRMHFPLHADKYNILYKKKKFSSYYINFCKSPL